MVGPSVASLLLVSFEVLGCPLQLAGEELDAHEDAVYDDTSDGVISLWILDKDNNIQGQYAGSACQLDNL